MKRLLTTALLAISSPDGKSASYRSEIRNDSVVIAAQDAALALTP